MPLIRPSLSWFGQNWETAENIFCSEVFLSTGVLPSDMAVRGRGRAYSKRAPASGLLLQRTSLPCLVRRLQGGSATEFSTKVSRSFFEIRQIAGHEMMLGMSAQRANRKQALPLPQPLTRPPRDFAVGHNYACNLPNLRQTEGALDHPGMNKTHMKTHVIPVGQGWRSRLSSSFHSRSLIKTA